MGGKLSGTLHSELLSKVINAPTNLFFDVTPFGKLLGNFTTGIRKADSDLFTSVVWTMYGFCSVISKVLFALYFSPYMIFPILLNIYCVWSVQCKINPVKSELIRLNSKANTKRSTHFTETFGGLSVIQAFGKEEDF
jgi:ABC-type multidrug transport system fused ATPase/permease subunit